MRDSEHWEAIPGIFMHSVSMHWDMHFVIIICISLIDFIIEEPMHMASIRLAFMLHLVSMHMASMCWEIIICISLMHFMVGASMHLVFMQFDIIMERPFMDFIMDASMFMVFMQVVIIMERSFMDFIMGAFICIGSIDRAVMHCAMHWDMTAWKSQTAFSIRMSIHFAAVIMAVSLQPSLCLAPSDFIMVNHILRAGDPAATGIFTI
ncbi:MAG: hypothetical protein LUQ71_06985 [Methanoregula sp.]|nr:hypothetical protein [Methanoregula sp.]